MSCAGRNHVPGVLYFSAGLLRVRGSLGNIFNIFTLREKSGKFETFQGNLGGLEDDQGKLTLVRDVREFYVITSVRTMLVADH